mgnify:CR=1 FL=1
MKVIDLARRLGINSSKVRYYDKIGLLDVERNSNNKYRNFSDLDALKIMHIETLRSFSFNIEQTRQVCSMHDDEVNHQLHKQKEVIELSIQFEQAKLNRLEETLQYIEKMDKEDNRISFFKVPDCWMIFSIGVNHDLSIDEYAEAQKLAAVFPFSYVALHIPLESIKKDKELKMEIGFGILGKYQYILEENRVNDVIHYPGGNTVQLYIETSNPFKLTQKDIQPLRDYLKDQNRGLDKDLYGRVYMGYQKENKFYFGITIGYKIE